MFRPKVVPDKPQLASVGMSGNADPPDMSDDGDLLQQSDDEAVSRHSAGSSAPLSLARSSPPGSASDLDLLEENEADVLQNDSDAASSRSPPNRSIML